MIEADFSGELVKSLKMAGAWAFKIPDAPYSKAIKRRPIYKHYDISAVYQAMPIAIECKLLHGFEAFGIRHLRESQINALTNHSRCGGLAFVALNVRIPYQENRLIIWPWIDFLSAAAPTSIPGKALVDLPYIQGEAGVFPVFDWLQKLEPDGRFLKPIDPVFL